MDKELSAGKTGANTPARGKATSKMGEGHTRVLQASRQKECGWTARELCEAGRIDV